MPRQPSQPEPSTALAIPEDIRRDLLRAQAESITTPQAFVRIKVLPAGVGQFEFGDTNDTTREFRGVILAHHARNVLWDRPFGSPEPEDEADKGPACRSRDGLVGTPRAGFRHAALNGARATGDERINCASCPYNQWESRHLIGLDGKGRAVTRQRAIFVVLPDRATPLELVITGTSIPVFDEYLTRLLNRGLPAQAVETIFRQTVKTKGTLRWAVVTYEQGATLSRDQFDGIMDLYREWGPRVNPSLRDAVPTTAPNAETTVVATDGDDFPEDDDAMPNF